VTEVDNNKNTTTEIETQPLKNRGISINTTPDVTGSRDETEDFIDDINSKDDTVIVGTPSFSNNIQQQQQQQQQPEQVKGDEDDVETIPTMLADDDDDDDVNHEKKVLKDVKEKVASSSLPSSLFRLNEKVEARFGGLTKYYKGYISSVNRNGTFSIVYDDGDSEKEVDPVFIKKPGAVTSPKIAMKSSVAQSTTTLSTKADDDNDNDDDFDDEFNHTNDVSHASHEPFVSEDVIDTVEDFEETDRAQGKEEEEDDDEKHKEDTPVKNKSTNFGIIQVSSSSLSPLPNNNRSDVRSKVNRSIEDSEISFGEEEEEEEEEERNVSHNSSVDSSHQEEEDEDKAHHMSAAAMLKSSQQQRRELQSKLNSTSPIKRESVTTTTTTVPTAAAAVTNKAATVVTMISEQEVMSSAAYQSALSVGIKKGIDEQIAKAVEKAVEAERSVTERRVSLLEEQLQRAEKLHKDENVIHIYHLLKN
jgi:hypothetical protein